MEEKTLDEIEKQLSALENQNEPRNEKLDLAVKEYDNKKSIDAISVSDIRIHLDDNKSIEAQAEDVVGAMVTANAINDQSVKSTLTDKKAEELVNKANEKATKAKKVAIDAETELQKAERDLYEAVLNTFGIYKHLPRGLMKILVWIFSPLYIFISLLIGLPCGFVKIIIDNLDGIVCRYDKTGDGVKPKIKVIFWIILALLVVGAICLTVLGCLHII